MTASPISGAALPASIRLDNDGALPCLRFALLDAAPQVRHAVTTRLGGGSGGPYASANLGLSVGDDRETVLAKRALATRLVADAAVQPVTVRQLHGVAAVRAYEPGEPGVPLAGADMIATDVPGVPLLVLAADCVPLIVVDPVRGAVAVVHAGWRGTAFGAGREAVASMARLFGSRPTDLLVALGPGIGGCCYEVGDDVAAAVVAAYDGFAERVVLPGRGERPHVDLVEALHLQLIAAGVKPDRLVRAKICTACCADLLYSHRREGEPTGRFGAIVCLTPTT